ncbi:DUF2505 domain-containing protein [Allokutzneria multivorans]|uniref:DUF2505 domain-containing protein n=1 Tax=Allokutzneria multivorans TaxID=1142134 RepID=A0ABP7RT06_9PSEU
MATSTETSHEFPFPAPALLAALTDADYLRARLAAVGGGKAELLSHESTDGESKAVLKQGVPADKLPSFVRTLINGDLVIERTERWRAAGEGAVGTVVASVPGAPASINCSLQLRPSGTGSQLLSSLEVRVSLPFVGGKVEKAIVEQIGKLLDAENTFTLSWLTGKP